MKFREGIIFAGLLLCGIQSANAANNCSTGAWDSVDSEDANLYVSSPIGVAPVFARYSGKCAMRVTDSGYVADNTPDHSRIRIRFYYLSKLTGGTGTAVIFRAFTDDGAGTEVFEIRRVNGDLVFDTTATTGGTTTSIPAPSGWTSIEVDWTATDVMKIWVNSDAATVANPPSISAGSANVKVGSTRLGMLDPLSGFGGNVLFDSYEAHSSTAVGLLLDCDANGVGGLSLSDIIAVINEKYGPKTLANGQPDCDRDGDVDLSDIIATIGKVYP